MHWCSEPSPMPPDHNSYISQKKCYYWSYILCYGTAYAWSRKFRSSSLRYACAVCSILDPVTTLTSGHNLMTLTSEHAHRSRCTYTCMYKYTDRQTENPQVILVTLCLHFAVRVKRHYMQNINVLKLPISECITQIVWMVSIGISSPPSPPLSVDKLISSCIFTPMYSHGYLYIIFSRKWQ